MTAPSPQESAQATDAVLQGGCTLYPAALLRAGTSAGGSPAAALTAPRTEAGPHPGRSSACLRQS